MSEAEHMIILTLTRPPGEIEVGCICPFLSIPPGPTSMRDVQERRKEVCLPDGVTGSQADPLRDRTVLLLGFGKLLLGAEGLLALLGR